MAQITPAWTLNSVALPTTGDVQMASWDGYFYVLLTHNSGTAIYSAPINTNGSVGTFTAQAAFPSGWSVGSYSWVYNGYLFTTAYSTSSTYAIFSAPLSGGTVGAWTNVRVDPTNNIDKCAVSWGCEGWGVGS